MTPTDIRHIDDKELMITWDDGHRSILDYRKLRLMCPCAQCVDEWTGKRMTSLENISDSIQPLKMSAVGRYAIRLDWNDGHTTGIYSYEYLRSLE